MRLRALPFAAKYIMRAVRPLYFMLRMDKFLCLPSDIVSLLKFFHFFSTLKHLPTEATDGIN